MTHANASDAPGRERGALRLFIALPCPAKADLRRLLNQLARDWPTVRPVAAGQLHLTVRFLGGTPTSRVGELRAAIDRAVAGADVSAMNVPVLGLGRMPERGRQPPRIVFAHVGGDAPLHRLADAVTRELAALRPPVEPDDRPFNPHLTLARIKRPPRAARDAAGRGQARSAERALTDRVAELLDRHRPVALAPLRIDRAELIASDLTPAGPIHRVLHTCPLPGGRGRS